jgi:circadian clock protein KaiB
MQTAIARFVRLEPRTILPIADCVLDIFPVSELASRSRSRLVPVRQGRHEETPLSDKYLLKLYVTGTSPRTSAAIANLERICQEELAGLYELEIIDVLENPQVAEDEKILATPTLIKQLPPPLRRVIGDLSDKEKVLFGLEVRPTLKPESRAQDAR